MQEYGKNVSEAWVNDVQPVIENWIKNSPEETAKIKRVVVAAEHVIDDIRNKMESQECSNNPCCEYQFVDCPSGSEAHGCVPHSFYNHHACHQPKNNVPPM